MKRRLLLLIIIFALSGCAAADQGGGQIDYEETKKMVVDILKTDEGKKAIEDVMADEKMRQNLVLDQQVVTESIAQTLNSDTGAKFWTKTFEDPKFAEAFAKSMQKEHETLIKDLMKDPEYQELMMQILQDPEMQKEYLTVIQSKEFRVHLQKVMTETFESPLFKAKLQAILLKGAEELQAGQPSDQGGGGQQGGSEGGEESAQSGSGGNGGQG
ncbi:MULTISPECIES: spore germination lipoprotein GerD [Bacillus]|uniref:spore germination lipoprotein GerD n=1 Tax=Bacillus TaxID=1386 RepID=UPI000BB87E3F|nr:MULTISPECIES: spore germination lipoprotein GerD [Bacillus]